MLLLGVVLPAYEFTTGGSGTVEFPGAEQVVQSLKADRADVKVGDIARNSRWRSLTQQNLELTSA